MKNSLLVVDDDALIRDVLKGAFNSHYLVLEASSCSDVMNFPSQSIDLAIIDYFLPDRDGFEVLQSLRGKNPTIPAIIMTGYGNEDLIIQALRNNVTDYMKKPLDLMYLRQRVADILRNVKKREDNILPPGKGSQLDSITKHIQDNYMTELTLDKLARLACMSRFSFSRAFSERFDQCLTSYVNSVRLKNAGELLLNSHDSITDIAFSVGYRNLGHFNRVFKTTYKMSPRDYRKRKVHNHQGIP
jgi:YesN/AraC family two-component response regulator